MKHKELEIETPHILTLSCALLTLGVVILLVGFIFYNAYPIFKSQGIYFILGDKWDPNTHVYGMKIYLVSTLVVTFVTIIMALPIGLFTAIFLAEFAPVKVASVIRPLIELLVGIPSVVYGIFGFFFLSKIYGNYLQPFVSNHIGFIWIFHDPGFYVGMGVFLASTILAIMILPTIIAVSEDTIRSVPYEFREASLALGATHFETIKKVILPTAKSGIITAVILGIMRAIGETMAVVMLIGCTYKIPNSIFDVCYPITAKLLNSFGEQMMSPEIMSSLYALAAFLFVLEFTLVSIAKKIGGKHYEI